MVFYAKNLSAEDYDKLMAINNTINMDANTQRSFADYQPYIKGFGRELIYYSRDEGGKSEDPRWYNRNTLV